LVLDPLSLLIVAVQGWVHNFARHYEEALPYYQQALQIDPDFFPARWFRGQAWVEMGRINDGIGELERAFDLGGQTSRSLAYLGYAYGRGGRVAEATAALETLRKRAADSYVPPYFSALIYCGLGDERRALEDLERAVALPDSMARDLKVDPAWDHLRDEPRMAAMLRRLRLA
jgi:tetratricopeptide (TPR) repeat protein